MSSTAANPRRRANRFGLVELLLAVALLSGWRLWPTIRVWWCNPWPEVLTLEEFITHGSRGEWIVLKDCYVDSTYSVQEPQNRWLETYYPIRSGPNDQRRVKVFVKPGCFSLGEKQAWLAREGEGPADVVSRVVASRDSELQEVSGVLAVGWQFPSGTRDLIRSEREHGAPDAVLLLHGSHPVSRIQGLAALALPLGSAGLAFFLIARKRRRSD
jgi:hypothetical protein